MGCGDCSEVSATNKSAQASQAVGGSSVIEIAPAPVLQMAAQGPVPDSAPFIGANHGASVWGRADAVVSEVRTIVYDILNKDQGQNDVSARTVSVFTVCTSCK